MSITTRQLHERPDVIAAGETPFGQAMIWLCATALMLWHDVTPLLPVALLLVILLPAQRRRIVGIAAIGAICEYFAVRQGLFADVSSANHGDWARALLGVTGVIGGLYLMYWLGLHFAKWPAPLRRYPVLSLHVGFWAGLGLIGPLPLLGILTELGPWLIWRLSYLVKFSSRRLAAGTGFIDHMMYLWPVYGGTSTPYGKGLDYLSRHEATNTATATRSQLAGVKLLILAVFWQFAVLLMDVLVFGADPPSKFTFFVPELSPGIPRLGNAIGMGDITPGVAWISLYLELIRDTLRLATTGHIIVGCLRLLGFNVFRNTYKPLLAESILEFWNRYYYYFKELLVDFFFYPVFLRSAWAGPRLRLFLAVFAAAFLGNMYYHVIGSPNLLVAGDLGAIWNRWNSRIVYCLLLATGIWISMLRQQKRRQTEVDRRFPVRLRAIAGVWTFYAIIHIWNVRAPGFTIGERTDFCFLLFGIN